MKGIIRFAQLSLVIAALLVTLGCNFLNRLFAAPDYSQDPSYQQAQEVLLESARNAALQESEESEDIQVNEPQTQLMMTTGTSCGVVASGGSVLAALDRRFPNFASMQISVKHIADGAIENFTTTQIVDEGVNPLVQPDDIVCMAMTIEAADQAAEDKFTELYPPSEE